ncbi:MAG: beta-ketoacyl-ACP synthase II [Coxiellaceae bacterium]|nr:beta-ketoacyl-ACP synthase II [Coxiellaceae bacterium]
MAKRRVVITGLGAVTPLGNDVESTWQAMLAGKSGAAPITERFDTEGLSTTFASMIKDFDPSLSLTPKEVRKTDLFVQYGAEVARQALSDSGIEITEENCHRCGTAFGAGIGGLLWIEDNHEKMVQKSPNRVSPFFIPGAIINMSAGIISMKNMLKGPIVSAVTACATGVHNIGLAARMIAYGDADVMLTGGAEVLNSKLTISGFAACRALSKRNDEPTKASRPWDKDRDGFVCGEGAAAVVLEEYEHAKARGAHIYAELAGFGMSSDAYHMTLPDPDATGAIACMRTAIADGGISADQVDYVNAHGTSTGAGDVAETKAVKKLFGDHAYKMPMSSTKSMTGHTLGAAGAIETVACVLALRDQVVPPTINLDNPDENCDLDYVPHTKREMPLEYVLNNSFGFGGANACLLLKRLS